MTRSAGTCRRRCRPSARGRRSAAWCTRWRGPGRPWCSWTASPKACSPGRICSLFSQGSPIHERAVVFGRAGDTVMSSNEPGELTPGFETQAIHAGQDPDPLTGSVVPPIYQTSTYKQDGVGGLRGGYEYSRTANPTRTALEECLAALDDGHRALAFASGMAAEDCLIRTVCRPGDRVIIPDDAYGGTYRLVSAALEPWGY